MRYLVLLFFLWSASGQAQEQAPLRHFQYTIDLSGIKTEAFANELEADISKIQGIQQAEIEFLEYELVFVCTNHDMTAFGAMDKLKAYLAGRNVSIGNIRREEVER